MILVVGGTGTLGRRLVPRLVARGEPVRLLSRTPTAPAFAVGAEVVTGDVRDPDAVARAVTGARVVIAAHTGFGPRRGTDTRSVDWHGTETLAAAAKAAGVEHLVLVSVHGAAQDHPVPLFRMKHHAEQSVAASGLDWTTIRPTACTETWLQVLADPLRETGKTRVFGRGRNPISFVSTQDVAAAVEAAVDDPAPCGAAIDLPGPEAVTMLDLLARFQESTGTTGRISHVPLPALRVLSTVLRPVNRSVAELMAAAVLLDTADMAAAPQGRLDSFRATTTVDQAIHLLDAERRQAA